MMPRLAAAEAVSACWSDGHPGFATPAALASHPPTRASPRPHRARGRGVLRWSRAATGPTRAVWFRDPCRACPSAALNIEVERVLPGMRAEPDRVHLVLALVVDPRLDHVRREHVALQQPVVRRLEVVEHDAEVAGELLDLLRLGRRQLVEILVDRLAMTDLVGDHVELLHHACPAAEVGVASRVRR